jgi:RNA polymerase-binding transcription factor
MAAVPQVLEQTGRQLRARRAELVVRRTRVENDLARRNEPLVADSSDQATQLQNDETLEEIGAAALYEIASIDLALERLSQGLYGTCSVCDEEIPAARLRAVPYATTCVDCSGC